ncbi:unnamed protein product [Kuraishia capsulata CBS 1993]|uniref:Uncharacterized protein n=1 Tax=Kuraishia capsulata CBS 1993 TaxID=1382522 RepID=W6MG30_9ASCO|nr:uncharacterized protein KUCA_T00000355001 [Kuraishia capsulata CBS 1993]CDK24393.1 unnamed protein product [Kuraishia capsulata CBS 1993]
MSLPSTPRRKSLGGSVPQRGILKRLNDENHTISLDPHSMAKKRVSFKSEASVLQIRENHASPKSPVPSMRSPIRSPGLFPNFQGRISFGLTAPSRFEIYQDRQKSQEPTSEDDVLDLFYEEGEIAQLRKKNDDADSEVEMEISSDDQMEFTEPLKPGDLPVLVESSETVQADPQDEDMELTQPLNLMQLKNEAQEEEKAQPMELTQVFNRPLDPVEDQVEQLMEFTKPVRPVVFTKPVQFKRLMENSPLRLTQSSELADLENSQSKPMELTQPIKPLELEESLETSQPMELTQPLEASLPLHSAKSEQLNQSQPKESTHPLETELEPELELSQAPMDFTQPLQSSTRMSYTPSTPAQSFMKLQPEIEDSQEADESIIEADYEPTETFEFFKEVGIDFRENISPFEPRFKPEHRDAPQEDDFAKAIPRMPELLLVMYELLQMINTIQDRKSLLVEEEARLTKHNTKLMRDYRLSDRQTQKQLRSMFLNTRDVKKHNAGLEFYQFKNINLESIEKDLGDYNDTITLRAEDAALQSSKLADDNERIRIKIHEMKSRVANLKAAKMTPVEFADLKHGLANRTEELISLQAKAAELNLQKQALESSSKTTESLVEQICLENEAIAHRILQNQDVKASKIRYALVEHLSNLRLTKADKKTPDSRVVSVQGLGFETQVEMTSLQSLEEFQRNAYGEQKRLVAEKLAKLYGHDKDLTNLRMA